MSNLDSYLQTLKSSRTITFTGRIAPFLLMFNLHVLEVLGFSNINKHFIIPFEVIQVCPMTSFF